MITRTELEDQFEDFVFDELESKELADRTIKKYEVNVCYFLKYLKEREMTEIDKNRYKDFRSYLKNDLHRKVSTINLYVVTLNHYFSYLKHDELKIKTIKVQRKQSVENVPDAKLYKRMIRTANKHNLEETKLIMETISHSGIRVAELCFITLETLKKAKKYKCILVDNKGKTREIVLPSWLIRDLLNFAKKIGIKEGPIFQSKRNKGKPYAESTIWRRIQKVVCLAKINKAYGHPHALRHLFAKRFLELHKNDYATLADFLGHNDIKTTMIYGQLSREEKKKVIDDLKY